MPAVGTFKRIISERCQNGSSPLSKAKEELFLLPGNSPMKPLILLAVSGIKPTISNHLEMLFGYVANQAFDKVNSRNRFDDIFIIFVAVVMKSNRISIIRVDSGCGDHRPSEITADILYYG